MNRPRQATDEQIKAAASPLRLRILRLCHQGEWTNKQLADRLGKDPSTILHHLRILEKAGFVESTGVRRGPSGAYEKPYRSTGLSWQLSFGLPEQGEPSILTAFREELAEAGHESIGDLTRFYLHLSVKDLERFSLRFRELVEEFRTDDEDREDLGAPVYSGLLVLHRLAADRPEV